ncbi:MAG: 6-phosphogluconolactonase, partial [Planctomycetes bacterium]|nr:6-phosphogluconolactonase [Planctomycetota bacterium]
ADLRALLARQATVRAVFAAGESQGSFLEALSREPDLAWDRIDCFNIDDFWDVRMPAQFTCGTQTRRQLYDRIAARSVNLVRFDAPDPEAEARRFESQLRAAPIDILCQGIGTSGHLALNEPNDTDFADARAVRVVEVCEQSKRQLREDPNFKALGYIPEKGITMTIPAIVAVPRIYTIVPLALKKPILTKLAALPRPTVELPASILVDTPGIMFVDRNSCPDAWIRK